MSTSVNVIFRNSTAALPGRRAVNTASFRCLPLAHAKNSCGDAVVDLVTNETSLNDALPAPPPPPPPAVCVSPQLNASTSSSPACLMSVLSPLTPSILRNDSPGTNRTVLVETLDCACGL